MAGRIGKQRGKSTKKHDVEKANKEEEDPQFFLEARPTQRMAHTDIQADGDTWQETLAVVVKESTTESRQPQQLMIRSYFENSRSGKRVWDEPPSGASHVRAATEEMHRMAQVQLQEMQIVVSGIPTTTSTGTAASTPAHDDHGTKEKRRGFLFGFGKKKISNDDQNNDTSSAMSHRIRYKPGSNLLAARPSKHGKDVKTTATTGEDLLLQQAIAQSLAQQQGIPYDGHLDPHSYGHPYTAEEEELEMVKALSLSTAHHENHYDSSMKQQQLQPIRLDAEEEEERLILARVLKESKLEVTRNYQHEVSRAPKSARSKSSKPTTNYGAGDGNDGEVNPYYDCKPPARKKSPPAPATATATAGPAGYFTAGATTTVPMSSRRRATSEVASAPPAGTTTYSSLSSSSRPSSGKHPTTRGTTATSTSSGNPTTASRKVNYHGAELV